LFLETIQMQAALIDLIFLEISFNFPSIVSLNCRITA
jgi:hypothetical protein